MVHKIMMRNKEGRLIETDEGMIILTDREYKKAKKRFKSKYDVPDLKRHKK